MASGEGKNGRNLQIRCGFIEGEETIDFEALLVKILVPPRARVLGVFADCGCLARICRDHGFDYLGVDEEPAQETEPPVGHARRAPRRRQASPSSASADPAVIASPTRRPGGR